MLPTKFRFVWLGICSEEDFFEIDQSETKIAGFRPDPLTNGCHRQFLFLIG
jgi:hypothetical protein